MRYHELPRDSLITVHARQKLLADNNLGYPSFPRELVARQE